MSDPENSGRVPVASETYFRVRLTLREGYSGDFADLASDIWRGLPEVVKDRAFRRRGEPWHVVVLTLDTRANRATADRVAAGLAQHPKIEAAEVLEDRATIWSDARFLAAGPAHSQPDLYASLVLLFFIHDPVSINFEFNTDEYEREVRTVLPRLPSATSRDDVTRILHEEFVKWFDATVGPRDRYERLASDVWRIWQGHA